jgi:hypothetical protein
VALQLPLPLGRGLAARLAAQAGLGGAGPSCRVRSVTASRANWPSSTRLAGRLLPRRSAAALELRGQGQPGPAAGAGRAGGGQVVHVGGQRATQLQGGQAGVQGGRLPLVELQRQVGQGLSAVTR